MDSDFNHFLFVAKPANNMIIPIIKTIKIPRTVTQIPPLTSFLLKPACSPKMFSIFSEHSL